MVAIAVLLQADSAAHAADYDALFSQQPADSSEPLNATITSVRSADEFERVATLPAGHFQSAEPTWASATDLCCEEPWTWQVLPDGLVYRTYLASPTAPRLGATFNYEQNDGWVWDLAAGARIGLVRYGTTDGVYPDGWQLDIEGAAFPRLTPVEFPPILEATDYRFGIPLTYGCGPHRFKFAYYHLSSHLADEYAQLNGGLGQRINYALDAFVLGYTYNATDFWRMYGEVSYSFSYDISEPLHFQFGVEHSPLHYVGNHGVPFFAANVRLREEVNFGGDFVVQTGWQWNSRDDGRRLRVGVQYYNGNHEKFQFFQKSEQKIGIGIWHDF